MRNSKPSKFKNFVSLPLMTSYFLVACSDNQTTQDNKPVVPKASNSFDAISQLPNFVQQRVTAWTGRRVKGCDTGDIINQNSSLLFLDANILSGSSHIVTRQRGVLGEGFAVLTDYVIPNYTTNSELTDVYKEAGKSTAYQIKTKLKDGVCELEVNGVTVSSTPMFQSAKITASWAPARGVSPQIPVIVKREFTTSTLELGTNTPANVYFSPRDQDYDFLAEVWALDKQKIRSLIGLKQNIQFQEKIKQQDFSSSWQASNKLLIFDESTIGNLELNSKNKGTNTFELVLTLPEFLGKGVSVTSKIIYTRFQLEASAKPGESSFVKYKLYSEPVLLNEEPK